jgi:thiol:disulfide interchange protein
MNKIKSLFFIILMFFFGPAAAQELPIAQATLYSESTAIAADTPFRLGVLIEPNAPGWHTYWENPGDAGLATTLEWTLPEGFVATKIDWPAPKRIEEGPLTVYGYKGPLFLPVTITPPEKLDAPSYTFRVTANWLICKDICIPESATLDITLPAGAASLSPTMHFSAHDARKPAIVAFSAAYTLADNQLVLSVPLAYLNIKETITAATFFIREPNIVRYAAQQNFSVTDDTLQLTLERSETAPPETLHGLLSITAGGEDKVFDILLQNAGVLSAAQGLANPSTPLHSLQDTSIVTLLFFAMIGGLILNLMPCVLPVLSLKALALVKKSAAERVHVRAQGLSYTFGILVSFALLAGALLALKNAGEAVGWGFQMQSPPFVGFLIYLLFLVGLSLSGLFHLPVLLGTAGGDAVNESSTRGSFLTGVLATAVATPCTAPFMAPAIGAALTLSDWQAMLVFQALGLGLALPFLLISFFPQLLRFLPKPGAWMETFKHILAWPMYLSVLWLLWVLWEQTGMTGLALALVGMAVILLSLKAKKHAVTLGLILAAIVLTLPLFGHFEKDMTMPAAAMSHDVDVAEFSKAKLEELRAAGKPVFVDATAAWCITCQVNARIAIHTEHTMQAFRERGVTLMIADWTRRNAEITEFLASFGYRGVPLYVYYPPNNGEPKILPQLLTESIVVEAITP